MSVVTETIEPRLQYECRNCYSEMMLPKHVSSDPETERCIFQCPICDEEADIDISNYPMVGVRVVVNDYERIADGEGSD